MEALGAWQGGALGASRASRVLDLGESGTAFRFALAAATLRLGGARTLVRGRPVLLRRPHRPLQRALRRLGARLKRRHSGAVRVLGGGLRGGGRLVLDTSRSSQYASALLLVAPRIGGLALDLPEPVASRAYLDLTVALLRRFHVPVERTPAAAGRPERIAVGAAAPAAGEVVLEPDASAAAAWWAAAALGRGEAWVPGLARTSAQADTALWDLLAAMGAEVRTDQEGWVRVRGTGRLAAPAAEVDLRRSPDLIFLAGALAAAAEGTTVLRGLAHTRGKESDRMAVMARGLQALGADVRVEGDDRVVVRGGGLHGGTVDCGGDHRAAIGFGVLGLAVPGVVLAGAEVVAKSQPGFLQELARLGGEGSETR
jgi:3-phosphoshikimate 1-carboxyvinyltransferase